MLVIIALLIAILLLLAGPRFIGMACLGLFGWWCILWLLGAA